MSAPGLAAAHGVFTIERTYASVAPQRVFDAFASIEGKIGWFTAPNDQWDIVERTMDFRVGGRDRLKGRWRSGLTTEFDATYFDIISGERLRNGPEVIPDLTHPGTTWHPKRRNTLFEIRLLSRSTGTTLLIFP